METKVIELFIDDIGEWCDKIALVENPAIESDFLAFSKVRENFTADEEKHVITGAVMVPDFKIIRYDENDQPYYVFFSRETIEKISQRWLKEDMNKAFNIEHLFDTSGVSIVESWLKSDMSADKSVAVGLPANLPVGTWFISCKVDNADVWQSIKDGDFKGFSIQGWFHQNDDISDEELMSALSAMFK